MEVKFGPQPRSLTVIALKLTLGKGLTLPLVLFAKFRRELELEESKVALGRSFYLQDDLK